jgi:hypothetical protein
MPSPFVVVAAVLAFLAVVFLVLGLLAIRRDRILGMAVSLAVGLLLLTSAGLCATIAVATRGYRAFAREEVAAVVETRPTGAQSFTALVRFPDGREKSFSLSGDQLYVDAHILKWKPLASLLGLHTAYELDRVAGRYLRIEDERSRPRSAFALSEEKPVNMYTLRRRFPLFRPLVDAEYDSVTFVLAERRATYEVRVSSTGLMIRPVGESGG